MKCNYTFNLKLAFGFKKSSTLPTKESGKVNAQVDSSNKKSLMTTLLALMPLVRFITICLKICLVFLINS
ncbi:Uncharacterised protein [Yersinia kristensenii]|nr:Uncharacterised protein [Yersinia aleksiciae]CNG51387.1 Uncharacterised protein [Yersinia kristensenii]CNK26658.1 Uncharacterised protein [Yersinia kristensenii]